MQKSIYDPGYRAIIRMMREERVSQGVSQVDLAKRLGVTPSELSKWERAERRVDLRELRLYLTSLNVDLVVFVARWLAESP